MTKSGGKLEFEIPPEGLSGSSVTTGALSLVHQQQLPLSAPRHGTPFCVFSLRQQSALSCAFLAVLALPARSMQSSAHDLSPPRRRLPTLC